MHLTPAASKVTGNPCSPAHRDRWRGPPYVAHGWSTPVVAAMHGSDGRSAITLAITAWSELPHQDAIESRMSPGKFISLMVNKCPGN